MVNEVINMAKLNQRLSELFQTQEKQTTYCDLDILLSDIPVARQLYPEILRCSAYIGSHGMRTKPSVSLVGGKYLLMDKLLMCQGAKLLGISEIECTIVGADIYEVARNRFDDLPNEQFRSLVIRRLLANYPGLDRARLANELSVTRNRLGVYIGDALRLK